MTNMNGYQDETRTRIMIGQCFNLAHAEILKETNYFLVESTTTEVSNFKLNEFVNDRLINRTKELFHQLQAINEQILFEINFKEQGGNQQ